MRYGPVGKCIYCGAGPDCSRLTDEHIVPYGLSGDIILPKSSCDPCADITKKFEQYCLRVILQHARLHFSLKTRNKKDRPKTIPAGKITAHKFIVREMRVEDHPVKIALPRFMPPRFLAGLPKVAGIEIAGINALFNEKWHQSRHAYGNGTAFHFQFEVSNFCRLLEKIAHGFAVAERGIDGFLPLLQPSIRGDDPFCCHYVGNMSVPFAATSELHKLSLFEAEGLLLCNVGLFAKYGAEPYTVVVGRAAGQ